MIVSDSTNSESADHHVEFVFYTGSYPCLCSGILILLIDGIVYTFGNDYDATVDFGSFWRSGGSVDISRDEFHVEENEWIIDIDKIPEQFRQYAEEIDKVFNENVEHGCCGGCI